jgi:hypothetical protein
MRAEDVGEATEMSLALLVGEHARGVDFYPYK